MKEHYATEHPETKSKTACAVCNKAFESKHLMMEHYELEHPESRIYNCSVCDERYLTLNGLQTHAFVTHERNVTEKVISYKK